MPRVIPKLNLNKHPAEVNNGSLIDATNIIVSNDNAVIQTEPQLLSSDINSKLIELIGDDVEYEIKYCISCNTELILFILNKSNDNIINIYRYNEKLNEIKYCTNTDYHGGNLIGTFTYNYNNLIIAFSEYFEDDSNKIPLKTINLGNFKDNINSQDVNQLNNNKLHPICPEVIIPKITATHQYGNAYKGWYFIFIRYKISNNTYTQWFNTNESILIDNFRKEKLFKSYISPDVKGIKDKTNTNLIGEITISDDKDICELTFKCTIENKDTNFKYYQLGFINATKSALKAFATNDIDINTNEYIFEKNTIIESSAGELITTYNNYYNIKSLTTIGNRLFIGNYKENNKENDIVSSLKDISVTVKFKEIDSSADDIVESPDKTYKINITKENFDTVLSVVGKQYKTEDSSFIYYTAASCPIYTQDGAKFVKMYFTNPLTIKYKSKETNEYVEEVYNPEDIIIAPFVNWTAANEQIVQGKIYFIKDGKLVDLIANDIVENKQFTLITKNGDSTFTNGGVVICLPHTDCNFTYSENISSVDYINAINILQSTGIFPREPYNFFIHFVDKYGTITNGFNLSNFTLNCDERTITNLNDDVIIFAPDTTDNNKYLLADFTISKLPEDYVAWFVSYEQAERLIKYKGILGGNENINSIKEIYDTRGHDGSFEGDKINGSVNDDANDSSNIGSNENSDGNYFYTDEFNFKDTIDLDFDFIRVYSTTAITYGSSYCHVDYKNNKTYHDYNILNKNLLVADSYNNIGFSTRLKLNLEGVNGSIQYSYIAELIKKEEKLYNKENKILIPCSKIIYTELTAEVNTKDSFITQYHAFVYNGSFYNETVKYFQKENSVYPDLLPLFIKRFYDYDEIPWETLQTNNKPIVTFFPNQGLNTTDENEKSFISGFIVEAKNTIDLLQQKNNIIYDNHPKSLINYNADNIYTNDFPKTIRRSNIIQDESHSNSWRQFELEQYKNITENKGDIVKLIAIGYYFIVHCQHSLFLFNGTDSIESKENTIQLSSVDFWNIQYKEIVTSDLGYAGIQKEYSGIIGSFGYIFYDSDAQRFYRYDNNSISYIDSDINNFIKTLKDYNVYFVDDKHRNRLLISFVKDDADEIILSYNYNINSFVSRHDYKYLRGYSTKENIYIINKYDDSLKRTDINIFNSKLYNHSKIHVMLNDNYINMKYIEYIIYKIVKVKQTSDFNYFPVEEIEDRYSADFIRIYNIHCDTGLIDTTFDIDSDNNENNINNIMDYIKPYWRFGNWHFNVIRNNLKSYIDKESINDECSRIFGNWFVVEFDININEQVELETLDAIYNNAEIR